MTENPQRYCQSIEDGMRKVDGGGRWEGWDEESPSRVDADVKDK